MLPGRDGFSICDEVRKVDREQPIILLTAKTSDEDIVNGLTLGADDYIAKPFAIAQLVLRVKAVLRRSRVGARERGADRARGRRDRYAESLRQSRQRDARVHAPRDRDTAVPAARTPSAPCRARSCSRASGATTARPTSRRARSTSTSRSCGARSKPDPKEPRNLMTVRGAGYRLLHGGAEIARPRQWPQALDERGLDSVAARRVFPRARGSGGRAGRAGVRPAEVGGVPAQPAARRGARRRKSTPGCARPSRPRMRARSATIRSSSSRADAAANFVQRSPLSAFPVASARARRARLFPGGRAGKLTTPLLPAPKSAPRATESRADEQTRAPRAVRVAARRARARIDSCSARPRREPPAARSWQSKRPRPRPQRCARRRRASPALPHIDGAAAARGGTAFAQSLDFTRDAAQKLKRRSRKRKRRRPRSTGSRRARRPRRAPPKKRSSEGGRGVPRGRRQRQVARSDAPKDGELSEAVVDFQGAERASRQIAERRKRSEQSLVPEAEPAVRERDADKAAANSGKGGARNGVPRAARSRARSTRSRSACSTPARS